MDWAQVQMRDIAHIVMGQSPPGETYNENGKGLPFFQGKADFGDQYPTPRKWCSAPIRTAESGDILLSVRAPVGPTNVIRERACIGRGLAAIRGNPVRVEQAYLLFFLKQAEPALKLLAHGSTFTAIKGDDVGRLKVPLPPLSVQRRIVDILDQADRLRRLRAEANAKTARILPALFIKMFGDPATNPMGWPCRPLSDLAIKLSDGPFGSNLKTSHYTQRGVRVVRLQNVGVGHFLDEDKAFITPYHFASLAKHRCVPGDVIVATLGDPNLRACVLPENLPESLNKADCIQIRPKHGLAVAEYICWLLNASGTVGMAKRLIHGQTRTRISMGLLKGLSVPVPRYELQMRFASYVKGTNLLTGKCGNLNGCLSRLWNLLAHAAFAQH